MKGLIRDYWAVEVPVGATGFDINRYSAGSELNYWQIDGDKQTLTVIDLPPGTWEIVCTSKDATEEQAAAIVEEHRIRGNLRYEDYTREFMWQETAVDSLRSLLTSKGCNLNNNYLIIKKG